MKGIGDRPIGATYLSLIHILQAGSSSLGGFLINYLYGFLLLLLPLVFSILAANRLVARWVDTGSMAYLLASPNTRARVARTQALVLIAGGTLLTAYCTALAVGCAAAMFPGEDVYKRQSSYSSLRWCGGVVTSFYQGSVWTSFCSPKVLHLIV